jgi:hypothetical protein
MLKLVMASRRPLSVRIFDFLEMDLVFAFSGIPSLPPIDNDVREKRLRSIGTDLIELVPPTHSLDTLGCDVIFIHRTVHEFLSTSSMQEFLTTYTRARFDADSYLSQAFLILVQIIGSCTPGLHTKGTAVNNEVHAILDEMGLHMRRMERQEIARHDRLVELLIDGLGHSLDNLYNKHGLDPFPLPGWDDGYKGSYIGTFAIHQGLCGVVYRQLYRRRGIINDIDSKFPPIHYALYHICYAPPEHQEKKRDMVHLLLRHGANPNYPCPGGSPWKLFLDECYSHHPKGLYSYTVAIMNALIDAGACPITAKGAVSIALIESPDWEADSDAVQRLEYAVKEHRFFAHIHCHWQLIHHDFFKYQMVLKFLATNALGFGFLQIGLISSILVSLLYFLIWTR